MRIGVFADSHDHLDNVKRVVEIFNQRECELVLFAGDLVSTICIPPLRRLRCPLFGCFGDNEGNRIGIHGGMRIIGQLADPPVGFQAPDGTRILLSHQWELFRRELGEADVVICGHTHRPSIRRDNAGRLLVNPGETGGWTYGRPSIAILETQPLAAEIVWLNPPASGEGTEDRPNVTDPRH